ncbi:MAG TPA: hypothetical protein VHK88_19420 [Aquihabitans sp.]|jgi:hypothetical protein|nr:hypothetical protein [Aquihabitans sp.]
MKRSPKSILAIMVGAFALLAFAPSAYAQDVTNCDDYTTQAEAQAVLDADPSDPNGLDGNDNDGLACEDYFGGVDGNGGENGGTDEGGTDDGAAPTGGVATGGGGAAPAPSGGTPWVAVAGVTTIGLVGAAAISFRLRTR